MSEQELLGEILKKRRQERGLSLNDVAQRIRIRRQYLEALEDERFEEFPGEAYLKGFLRNYAEFLDLNPGEMFARYRAQRPEAPVAASELHRVETELVEPVRFATSGKRVFWIVLLVVITGLVIGYFLAGKPAFVSAPATLPVAQEKAPAPVAVLSEPAPMKSPVATATPPAGDETQMSPGEPGEAVAGEEAAVAARAGREAAAGVFSTIMAASGGTVRLQAIDPTGLEIVIDDRPLQRYELQVGAVLTWRVRRSARLLIEHPQAVKVWVEDRLLETGNRPELLISTAGAAVNP